MKHTLLVVEDNPMMRDALTVVLSERFDVDAVALARTALSRIESRAYSLALVDLGLPDLDGVQLVASVRARAPRLPILVLTIEDAKSRVLAALSAGASGYLLKDRIAVELVSAIHAALDGESPLSPRAARHVVASLHGSQPAPPLELHLTASERRVLEALARGFTYEQIGVMLEISVNTVRSRVRTLYDKLDVASRTEAVVIAAQRGLIQLES
jgi:DNA-binding NarL/FixJ family response regulator